MKGKKKGKPPTKETYLLLSKYMNNYNKEKLNTWLYMRFTHDMSSEFGNYLPYPNKHFINANGSKVYCWLIDGFFDTNKNHKYLNDIIARMMITFPQANVYKLKQYKTSKEKIKPIPLKFFQNLKSIKSKIYNYEKTNQVECEDQVFWALKLYFEQMIKDDNYSYDHFLDFAFWNFEDRAKDRSTLRAKCRSIYHYYSDRDFQTFCEYKRKLSDEEYLMTRQENMKKQSLNRAKETQRKVLNLISGMFKDEYKKPNGKWNISLIAKESGSSRNSVYKYIKEYEETTK